MIFLSMIILITTWVFNLFYGLQITEFVFDGFLYITVVGLSVTTAEKFSRKGETISVEPTLKEEELLK